MLFVVIGHDAPGSADKRPRLRPDHLAHIEPLSRAGRIPLAGPFTDGTGSLIVVEADTLEEVWRLVAADPYVKGGVFDRVEVKPFRRVFPE
ncbi:MAG: YciI family protein [Candidatus Binatia bacterium]